MSETCCGCTTSETAVAGCELQYFIGLFINHCAVYLHRETSLKMSQTDSMLHLAPQSLLVCYRFGCLGVVISFLVGVGKINKVAV